MTEKMVYAMIGVIGYFLAYLVVGCGITLIWKLWLNHKFGIFWEYSYNEGLWMYYPKMGYWMNDYRILYTMLHAILWPVMVPGQLMLITKVLRRVMSREYWY